MILLPQHEKLVRDSGIPHDVMTARGYRTVTTKTELERLGFGESQRRVPALLVPVWNVHGEIGTYQIRPDEPRVVDGKPLKYETPRGTRMVLDVPPAVRLKLADPKVPLFVTEGARKADAAASRGLACVALLGVWNWRGSNETGGKTALADWESVALNNRDVYTVFDSDVTTKRAVHDALARLKAFLESRKANVRIVHLSPNDDGSKVGLDDFLAHGKGVGDLLALAKSELPAVVDDEKDKQERASAATRLVELGDEAELFHDADGNGYATVKISEHDETWSLRSRAFRSFLARRYFKVEEKAPGNQALMDALSVLEGKAGFEGPERRVDLRVAPHGSGIALDLGSPSWDAVEINKDGWNVVTASPVRFRRPRGMLALPTPVRGGSVDELRPFVNVADDATFRLLVAWLVAAFKPTGPYPILCVTGEQGSAKSTTSRVVRALVDPASSPLRTLPREERDLMIAARNSWCVAFDNLSGLSPWISDALCRLATGGGFATRELYSDDAEAIFDAQRPIVLNGIDSLATRPDLLDRSLVVDLPRIPKNTRRAEGDFWIEVARVLPRVLGALLDGVVAALKNIENVHLNELPRMADFAKWVTAAESGLGWATGSFMAAYDRNQGDAVEEGIDADAVAVGLRAFMSSRTSWTGSAGDVLVLLEQHVPEATRRHREWPRSARALADRLKRLAPPLRAIGIDMARAERTFHGRAWTITRRERGDTTDMTAMTVMDPGQALHGELVAPHDGRGESAKSTVMDAPWTDMHDGRRVAPDRSSWRPSCSEPSDYAAHDGHDGHVGRIPLFFPVEPGAIGQVERVDEHSDADVFAGEESGEDDGDREKFVL